VTDETCPNCYSEAHVDVNATNRPAVYHCSRCDHAFNPPSWPCPWCNDESDVTRSPLDDYVEYYCYACNGAFDRLGPGFDHELVEEDELEIDGSTLRFTVETTTYPDGLRTDRRIRLRNDGSMSVEIRGWEPVALQQRVGEKEWVTLFGNPDGFVPTDRFALEPDDAVAWDLTIHPRGFEIEGQVTHRRPLLSGEYRFVYWGTAETDAVLARRFPIDFGRNQ